MKFGDFTLITRSKSFAAPVPDLSPLPPPGKHCSPHYFLLPKGIRLLGLGLHNLSEEQASEPLQLGLAI